MVIKASAAGEIRQLISALGGDDEVRRETAIARLAVIGGRAVDRLIAAYDAARDRDTRIAILRALEPIGDGRLVPLARTAISEGGDVAVAAAAALRGLLDAAHAPTATEALDTLVSFALDPSAERRVRLAAVDALQDMPEGVRARVANALAEAGDQALTARVGTLARDAAAADAIWQDALDGRLPDAPAALRDAARTRAAAAALSTLQKLIDAVRVHEGSVGSDARRAEWQAVRGALHQSLALRGSRLAVYDLRETLAQAQAPLPISFLTALQVVGDQSCLEPLAAAYSRRPAGARWRHQLATAFRTISAREKVTRRHAAMKRIVSKWPDAARELTAAS